MSHIRRIHGSLAVLSLLVPALVLATTPAAAQDGGTSTRPLTGFIFANVMTNADRPADDDEDWEARASIRPLGDCAPANGEGAVDTPWLNAGDQAVALLSLTECVFRISAVVREASKSADCFYAARIAWATGHADGSVLTAGLPTGASRLTIRRVPGGGCAQPNRTYFVIDGSDIVEALPDASAAEELLASARQAARIAAFGVRVEPAVGGGCDRFATFTVRGDGARVSQALYTGTDACPLRASVQGPPAPFEAPEGSSVPFDGAGANILVNISRLVRLRPARIAIIQDVAGSANRGGASYAISRTCGDASVGPPAGAPSPVRLYEGRYTVHAPGAAAFGPTATYPVGADAGDIVGCSVSVTVSGLPTDCTVAGGDTRSLTWTTANPLANFDFEFDITCGGASTSPGAGLPPEPPGGTGDPGGSGDSGATAPVASGADVRIVARKLANGKIEFGLQQRADDSWGRRRLPSLRLFPTGAAVEVWLRSSVLNLSVTPAPDSPAESVAVRIVARRHAGGKVEFALRQQAVDGSWGDPLLPTGRYFPADAPLGRWLVSTTLSLD